MFFKHGDRVMNNQRNDTDKSIKNKNDSDGKLEKIARAIDPPAREISDAELIDPGSNSPAGKPSHLTNPPTPDPKTPADSSKVKRQH
jgi:hypothetical protein